MTLSCPPPSSKLPAPVSVAAPASVYAGVLKRRWPGEAALKIEVLVPLVATVIVPVWTSTVPLLLKPSFCSVVVPVATLFRNVPALLNGWPAVQQWR